MSHKFKILLLGDFHFGESYLRAGAKTLADNGYKYPTKFLESFVADADRIVFNLETPLVDPDIHPSPLRGKKSYIHWADPLKTVGALKRLGVDAVSLANNHTLDHGVEGLISSISHLTDAGISYFGAGANRAEAAVPFAIEVPTDVGGGTVNLFGAFQYSKNYDTNFNFFAKKNSPGTQSLSPRSEFKLPKGNSFNILFPHWGSNYKWTTPQQQAIAASVVAQGFDAIIGHGSHSLQEIQTISNRQVVYGLGNGVFLSGGRFEQYQESEGIIPYGLWAMLEIESSGLTRKVSLKLYPVHANNHTTAFQPAPVDAEIFTDIVQLMNIKSDELSDGNSGSALRIGRDKLGYFIELSLGEWDPAEQVETLSYLTEIVDSTVKANTYTDSFTKSVLSDMNFHARNSGPSSIVKVAQQNDLQSMWIDGRRALVKDEQTSYLIFGHKSSESYVGARIIGDKYLTKQLLERAGVKTAQGKAVATANEALAFAKSVGGAIVLKPRYGQKGHGVSVNLTTDDEIISAFDQAHEFGEVIVEQQVDGFVEFRCMASPTECLSVVRRILPWVEGDGKHTISQLIARKNEVRQLNPSTHGRPIPIDTNTERFLAESNLSLDDILPKHERITVRNVGGLSSGGNPMNALTRFPMR